MSVAIPFPVNFVSSFGGLPRVGNEHVEITLHECAPALASMLRELVDADVPAVAHIEISQDGLVTLLSVEATAQVSA